MRGATSLFEVITGQDEVVAGWVAERLSPAGGYGPSRSIGVVSRDNLIAGAVFHNYDPKAGVIEVSIASSDPSWLSRRVLAALFSDYAFGAVGCQLVVMRTSARNLRGRSIARRAGFTEHVIPRLRGVDEAESVLTLTREAWSAHKLARPRHGRKTRHSAA